MPTETAALGEAGARLRDAVAAGDYGRAEELLAGYVRLVREAQDPAAAREARGVLEWARRATLAGRAHAAARFAQLRAAPRGYARAAPPASHTWELEG